MTHGDRDTQGRKVKPGHGTSSVATHGTPQTVATKAGGDADAWRFCGYDPGNPVTVALLEFLHLDMQETPLHAQTVASGIEAYCAGARDTYGGTGNAYEFDCVPHGLQLRPAYSDAAPTVTVPFAVALPALRAWADRYR